MNDSGFAATASRRLLAYPMLVIAFSLGFSHLAARETATAAPQDWSALNELVRTVQMKANKPISDAEVRLMVLKGFMREVDAHSSYLPEAEWQQKQEEMSGKYAGIGISIHQEGPGMFVGELAPDGPAARSGVRVGDQIMDIDGSLPPATVDSLSRMVRGEVGTPVVMTFMRPVKTPNRTYTVEIIRGEIRTPSVFSSRHADTGFIQLKHFSETSPRELASALAGLLDSANPIHQLVIDLRGNPGGLYYSGIELAAMFLPEGATISRTFHRNREVDSFKVTQLGVRDSNHSLVAVPPSTTAKLTKLPLAILVDRHTASSSEVVTAALMEYGRAIVVGEKTFGKGTMQSLLPLRRESGVAKLTTQEFRSPEGKVIDGTGIVPDVIVTRPPSEDATEKSSIFSRPDLPFDKPDPMLTKAIEVLDQFRKNASTYPGRNSRLGA